MKFTSTLIEYISEHYCPEEIKFIYNNANVQPLGIFLSEDGSLCDSRKHDPEHTIAHQNFTNNYSPPPICIHLTCIRVLQLLPCLGRNAKRGGAISSEKVSIVSVLIEISTDTRTKHLRYQLDKSQEFPIYRFNVPVLSV